ncbi:unnamed protein product [Arctogadus glacialis]
MSHSNFPALLHGSNWRCSTAQGYHNLQNSHIEEVAQPQDCSWCWCTLTTLVPGRRSRSHIHQHLKTCGLALPSQGPPHELNRFGPVRFDSADDYTCCTWKEKHIPYLPTPQYLTSDYWL